MRLLILKVVVLSLLFIPRPLFAGGATGVIVARITAFDSIRSQLTGLSIQRFAGRDYISGMFRGENVVLTYSPMGKVNNAITTQILLSRFEIDQVISIAPAGGVTRKVGIGSIILADQVFQHDFGTIKPYGFIWGKAPDGKGWQEPGYNAHLLASEGALAKLEAGREGRVFKGAVVSGDQLIASREKRSWLQEKFKALAVDMSAAAIVQTCFANGIPCQIIRVITDHADESARSDFEASLLPGSQEPDYRILFQALISTES